MILEMIMASRGVVNRLGFVSTSEYETISNKNFKNASELVGKNGNHSLPDYSHSKPNRIYVKTDDRGFRELCVYDEEGKAVLEIGFHREPNVPGGETEGVLHYHLFDENLKHLNAKPMTRGIYEKYKSYLNQWGIYWNE